MHTINSPTQNISRLLDRLIRPIFDEKVETTSIIDGAHLIKRLRQYTNDGHLKPTTLFCTFDINNLYTMFVCISRILLIREKKVLQGNCLIYVIRIILIIII